MTVTKRKRGRPPGMGSPRAHSLVSKLLTIAPGETVYLHESDPQSGSEWLSERNVHTVMARSPHLSGIRFSTSRVYGIGHNPARLIGMLAVTRKEDS